MMKKLLCTLLFAIIVVGNINAQFGSVSGGSPLQVIPTTSSAPPTNTPIAADGTDFGIVPLMGTSQHTFTFTSSVAVALLVQVQNITGPNAGEFSQSNPTPSSITGIGATSSFTVNFNPTTTGTKTAIIEVRVVQPPFFGSPESFFFTITGTTAPPTPSIKVTGDDSLIITNGSFNPSPGDNTHFGTAVANLQSVTRQFTIENDGTADLVINDITNAFGSSDFSIVLGPISFPLTIPASNSVSFDITFSPTSPASPPPITISAFIFIDAAIDTYDFFYEVEGEGAPPSPDMEVSGNSLVIADGDATPSLADHTDFGDVDINTVGGFSRTFTIRNTGTANLNLTSLSPIVNITGANAASFSIASSPTTPIAPGASTTFTVRFDPSTTGLKQANIVINNNTTNGKNPYNFVIQGNATDVGPTGQLLITQYYEGSGINTNRWIEVTNISGSPVTANAYNLCLYKDTNATLDDGNLASSPPQEFIPIGAMPIGGVRLYSRFGAVLPLAGNRGPATPEVTEVCSFNGNDLILISTSIGNNCYNDRTDIMGVVQATGTPPNWGLDKSFIKGCGTTKLPTKTFAVATGPSGLLVTDYLQVTLDEVNNAVGQTNLALGTQKIGTTTWTTAWDNGVPDKTRVVVISGTYSAANGSFAACDLTVTGNLDMNGGTSNYVEVNKSFTNTGTVTFGDQESFFSVNSLDPSNIGGTDVLITGNITKLETTSSLSDINDYTYWSSPVESLNLSSVFAPGVYNQGRLYYWNQAALNVIPNGGSEVRGEWIAAAGQTMNSGKGYISQGPLAGTYPGTATVSFTGKPKTGSVNLSGDGSGTSPSGTTAIDVVFNDNGNPYDDLNLVGNPYPSAIDADLFISQTNNATSINGTIWFWTHGTVNNGSTTGEQYTHDDYVIYNLSGSTSPLPGGVTLNGIIGSGQGFMVMANSSIEKITFTDRMRLKGQNTQFYKEVDTKNANTDEKDRVWLNLESSAGGAFSQILVGFFEDATDGFDRAYDGIRLNEGWANLYSKIDTLKYGIQGLSSFSTDKKVPLVFSTYIDDVNVTYTINIDRFEGALRDNDIYLVDNELNVTHDLKQGAYNFNITTPVDSNNGHFATERFTLQFTKATLGVDDLDLNNDFVIFNEENSLLVKSKTIISELKMYDITGRLLVNMLPNESEFRINTHNIRKGTILILNTTFENGTELSKKAIKY